MSGNFLEPTIHDVKLRLGELVRVLRKRENLTQEELGERLALSRMTIQNLEAGRNPTMDTVLIVMQHFGLMQDFHELLQKQITNNGYDSLY